MSIFNCQSTAKVYGKHSRESIVIPCISFHFISIVVPAFHLVVKVTRKDTHTKHNRVHFSAIGACWMKSLGDLIGSFFRARILIGQIKYFGPCRPKKGDFGTHAQEELIKSSFRAICAFCRERRR